MTNNNIAVDSGAVDEIRKLNSELDRELRTKDRKINALVDSLTCGNADEMSELLGVDKAEVVDEIDRIRQEYGEVKQELQSYREEHRAELEKELSKRTTYSADEIKSMPLNKLGERVSFLDHVTMDSDFTDSSAEDPTSFDNVEEGVSDKPTYVSSPKRWDVNPNEE